MPWMRGEIEMQDGSRYTGEFLVKDDRQLDSIFRPDINEEYSSDYDNDELVFEQVDARSTYQIPE